MNDKSILVQYIGDTPKIRIIDFFLDNKWCGYTKKEIMKYTQIPKYAFSKVWNEMVNDKVIKTSSKHKNTQLYTLNDNEPVRIIMDLDKKLTDRSIKN